MKQTTRTPGSEVSSSLLQDLLKQKSVGEQLRFLARSDESLTLPVIRCERCKGVISEPMVRGIVRRLKPWLLSVRARAFCSQCRLASPVEMRLHSGGIAEIRRNGNWVTRRPRKPPELRGALAEKSRGFAELVAIAYGKTREGVSYLYENRNEPLSTVFPKPAFLERFGRR